LGRLLVMRLSTQMRVQDSGYNHNNMLDIL
jgi:hypothetical protein